MAAAAAALAAAALAALAAQALAAQATHQVAQVTARTPPAMLAATSWAMGPPARGAA
jgi:hypothetical protein